MADFLREQGLFKSSSRPATSTSSAPPHRVGHRPSRGPIEIAPGCSVTYDLETIDILRALAQRAANKLDALKRYYQDSAELHGTRPTAAEAFRDGYNPRAVRQQGLGLHDKAGNV